MQTFAGIVDRVVHGTPHGRFTTAAQAIAILSLGNLGQQEQEETVGILSAGTNDRVWIRHDIDQRSHGLQLKILLLKTLGSASTETAHDNTHVKQLLSEHSSKGEDIRSECVVRHS